MNQTLIFRTYPDISILVHSIKTLTNSKSIILCVGLRGAQLSLSVLDDSKKSPEKKKSVYFHLVFRTTSKII